jgi:hypothetical protein
LRGEHGGFVTFSLDIPSRFATVEDWIRTDDSDGLEAYSDLIKSTLAINEDLNQFVPIIDTAYGTEYAFV